MNRRSVPHMFAEVAAKLEDLHAIAIEGQRPDNAPDMQRVLAFQLRTSVGAVDGMMSELKERLGDD